MTEAAAGRARWRRWRWLAVVVAVLAVALLAVTILAPGTAVGRLDPDSAAPQGSRALARILGDHGVAVHRTVRLDDAVAAASTGSTTLLLAPTAGLDPDQLHRIQQAGADLVLVEPDAVTLVALAPQLQATGVADRRPSAVAPGCADADALAAGPVLGGGFLVSPASPRPPGPVAQVCYPGGGQGTFALLTGPHRVAVLGQSDILTNRSLASEGDAALALRVLGRTPNLVWYLPQPGDVAATGASAGVAARDLLPGWFGTVAWLAALLVVLAALWRGRRLGPLVPEPLPVVVQAAETTLGRAALYRRAGARDRAAASLRAASMRRLGARLGLGERADASAVGPAAAARTGASPVDVGRLLAGPVPPDDAALVRLATELDTLERQVRRP